MLKHDESKVLYKAYLLIFWMELADIGVHVVYIVVYEALGYNWADCF